MNNYTIYIDYHLHEPRDEEKAEGPEEDSRRQF